MSEENDHTTVNYSGNSNKAKSSTPKNPDRPEVQKMVSGGVIKKKQSLGSRFRETFVGDDAQSVANYLLFDVVVPATKNLISDMVSQGIERLLFGTSTPRRGGSSSLVSRTSYSGISKNGGSQSRAISQQSRATHNFDSIILESRGEAEQVIDALSELIDQYGSATVSDLYSCVGISPDFPDVKYGWDNLSAAGVRHVRDGFLLDMPRPKVLD